MIKKIKDQWNGLNWLHVTLSVLLTSGLITSMFLGVVWTQIESKGNQIWAPKKTAEQILGRDEIIQVVAAAISTALEKHEKSQLFHPTSEQMDITYVRRREYESLTNRIDRMETNILTEIRNIRK